MSYTLVISEKPSAAKSIAEALSNTKPKKFGEKAVWYEFTRDGQQYVVVPAVGHLFTLKQTDKGWSYPNFAVEWVPSFKATKFAAFSQPYFENIERLSKDASDIIVATDYDDEGEVIGFNILRFMCKKENAKRMRFSTMTKEDLLSSFAHMEKLNKRLIESGLARHYIDWYWGINLTRALTLSIKRAAKRFRILSTGRVQGPTLHFLATHEKGIRAFVPKPFWQIELDVAVGKNTYKASYITDKVWNKKEAETVFKKANVKQATISDIQKKMMTQKPPAPYNTTAFLVDVYRYFGYSPQQGLNIAESLYQAGLISYPRTSSERLPPDIGYKKILTMLGKQAKYKKEADFLLAKKELKPTEGKRTDAAHPAIYPTGDMPKHIGDKQRKVYDLVVRRFMAVFGDPAKRESQKALLDVNGETFFISGKKTLEAGWTALYGSYAAREEIVLPTIAIGDTFAIKKTELFEKETPPPSRFSQGSVLKEMEEKGIGTKSTRAQILQILYNRGYLVGKSIEVTELGMQLVDILEKYVPDVVSEQLTRHMEDAMEKIESGEQSREELLEDVKKRLVKMFDEFRKKEIQVGEDLTKAVIATMDKQTILGTCRNCGGTLRVHKNWMTKKRFVGCTGYKNGCRTGFPLPREGTIIRLDQVCDKCKTPTIQVSHVGSRPFRMCLDPECETKKDWLDKAKLKKAKEESIKASARAQQLRCDTCSKQLMSKRALTLHAKTHEQAEA